MQEIAIFLSSIAGACTAAAAKKFPRNKAEVGTLGSNAHIKSQINSLRLEKEILTKTITRLYQNDSGLNKIQKDRLLLRYQHQLGIILAKIEKLEAASKHPDLGPIGEGLITLMDQKLSQLDKRLYELSSKITVSNSQIFEKKDEAIIPREETKKEKSVIKTQEIQTEPKEVEKKPQPMVIVPAIQASPVPKSVELITLTEISNKVPQFPFIEQKPIQPNDTVKEIVKQQQVPKQTEIVPTETKVEINPEKQIQEIQSSPSSQQENPPQLKEEKPQPQTHEEKIEEEENNDLDKIKGEIMKTLSRLEQAEVE